MSKKGASIRWSQSQLDTFTAKKAADIARRRPAVPVKAAPPAKAETAMQRFQALGRLPAGTLNKTETAYAEVLEAARIKGDIRWWKAHPINVRLADNTYYRVDFLVLAGDGTLEIHETKGGWTTDKGQMKIKLCAEILPVFRFLKMTKLPKKSGGGWKREEF